MPNLLQKIGGRSLSFGRSLLKMALPTSGRTWGGRSFLYGLLPGAKVDYRRLAGQLWKNSIVAASINWIGRNLPQAPPCVYSVNADGERKIVPKHPLAVLLNRPNPYYSGRTLRKATMLSLIVAGRAYWYIVRKNDGTPKELWYLPHFQVRAVPGPDTDSWITGYEYVQNGESQPLKFEDVIHFRDGLDPDYPWEGLSALASAFREVVTDNEASGYAAAILKNMGIPGAIITPKDSTRSFDPVEQQVLKEEYEESTQGDNRGRPMVLTGPVEVKALALSPEQLLLSSAQDKPEERICALIGIPPGVLQLGVGIKKSTFSNRDADTAAAWTQCIVPLLDIIHSELDVQLLPLLGKPASEEVGADYSQVQALQEARDALFARLTAAVGGPWMKPNEARQQAGLQELPEGDVLYPPKAGGAQPEPNDPEAGTEEEDPKEEDPAEEDKPAKKKPKKAAPRIDYPLADLAWAERVAGEIAAMERFDNGGDITDGHS